MRTTLQGLCDLLADSRDKVVAKLEPVNAKHMINKLMLFPVSQWKLWLGSHFVCVCFETG